MDPDPKYCLKASQIKHVGPMHVYQLETYMNTQKQTGASYFVTKNFFTYVLTIFEIRILYQVIGTASRRSKETEEKRESLPKRLQFMVLQCVDLKS